MNNLLPLLIKLEENEKRTLLIILFLVIIIFVIIGVFGNVIKKIISSQELRMNEMVYKAVKAKYFGDKTQKLINYGIKKSFRYFYKQAWKSILIILIGVGTFFITSSIKGHTLNLFDHSVEGEGFLTLFYKWDFSTFQVVGNSKGFELTWPELINTPHFEVSAIPSYVVFLTTLIGIPWLFFETQGLIARYVSIHKITRRIKKNALDSILGPDKD